MTPRKLKSTRESLGLSQAAFARMVGVASDRTVRKWENGERKIPGRVVVIMGLIASCPDARARLLASV